MCLGHQLVTCLPKTLKPSVNTASDHKNKNEKKNHLLVLSPSGIQGVISCASCIMPRWFLELDWHLSVTFWTRGLIYQSLQRTRVQAINTNGWKSLIIVALSITIFGKEMYCCMSDMNAYAMRHYSANSWLGNSRPVSNSSGKCAMAKNPTVEKTRVYTR